MSKKKEIVEVDPFATFNLLNEAGADYVAPTKIVDTNGNIIIEEVDEITEEVIEVKTKTDITKETNKDKSTDKVDEIVAKVEEEVEDDNDVYSIFATSLVEAGVIEEIPTDFVKSDDGLNTLVKGTISKGIKDGIAEYGQEFVQAAEFVKNGGTIKQYYDIIYNQETLEGINITLEENQKYILEEYIKSKDPDATKETIDEQITDYEESGILEKEAKRGLNYLKKQEAANKEFIVKQA